MGDKGINLLKAMFFLIIGIGSIIMALSGGAGTKKYPWIGAALCFFVTVNYVKKAFER